MPNSAQTNSDADTLGDACDNCPTVTNQNQSDLDGDKLGDACDPDRDGDGLPDTIDPRPTQPDTVLYYKQPGTAAGDFAGTGSWSPGGTSLCHAQTSSASHDLVRVSPTLVAANDYQAETRVTVSSINLGLPNWPAAGLAVRVKNLSPAQTYLCIVDLEQKLLVLGRFNPWLGLGQTAATSLAVPGSYRLRATVKGQQISCTEIVSGKTLSVSDSSYASGPPGFFTLLAAACYEYLWVTPAP